MIQSALLWPEHNELDLWPQALRHAEYLHNDTLHMMSWLSPNELCSCSKSSHSALINAHPWGCHVYILKPWLQYGVKLPKYEPLSIQGKYMGVSPIHFSTVGLIWYLNTNHMSPQFHVFYKNLFETFHSGEGEPPAKFPGLIVFDRFRSDFHDSNFVPE